jgi:hypothetical protein
MTIARPAVLLPLLLAFALTGCAPAATDSGTGDDGGTASGDACPVVAGYEYFSDSSVTAFPEPGQVFGDGTAITFEAPADYYATYTLDYVDENNEVFENSASGFSQEAPDGVFTTDNLVFGSEANGRPGILTLETVYRDGMVLDTPDPAYVDGVSTVALGRYCLTLKVE